MRLVADLRFAIRTLAKSPSFALVAILSLALGIGANTAMFSYVDAILLRPLPAPDSGRIVQVSNTAPGTPLASMSYPDFTDVRERSKTLAVLSCYQIFFAGVATKPDQVPHYTVALGASANFFSGLGIQPILGRAFSEREDSVEGRDLVAVIGYNLWDREFGHDASALGRKVRINGTEFTVIGVTPEKFTGPEAYLNPDVYIPVHAISAAVPGASPNDLATRSKRKFILYGRLNPGFSQEQAQAELSTIARDLAAQYPAEDRDRGITVLNYMKARFVNSPADATLSITLLAITGLVLLIACANVANLLLVRGTARAKEIAIRMAIGARRATLVRQLLTESFVLALLGGIAGIGVGYAGVAFLKSVPIVSDFPIELGVEMDSRLLIFSMLVAVATGVIFGLIPALRATRQDLSTSIKASDSGPARVSLFRGLLSGRNILVTAQLALSVILLVISADCVRGFQAAWQIDPGFRLDHTLFFSLDPSIQRYDEARSRTFMKQLTDRLRGVGGVEDVAVSSSVPFSTGQSMRKYLLDNEPPRRVDDVRSAVAYRVDEHYFPLMQAKLLRGRVFDTRDTAKSPRVAIINEILAKKLFGTSDPIGRQFRLDAADGAEVQVVGVAKKGIYFYWAEPDQEAVWTPYSQDFSSAMYVEMRTAGDPAALAPVVREQVRALDPDMPIFRVSTMQSFYHDRAMLGPRLIAQIVTATGLLGLLMAVIGLYGVVAYAVGRRTREFGIRIAIGATPRGILRMVLSQGAIFTVLGLAVGIGLIIPIAKKALPAIVIGADPLGMETMLGVPLILALAMLAACWIPARRAARIDPTRALRQD